MKLEKLLRSDVHFLSLQDKMWKLWKEHEKVIAYNTTFLLTILPGLFVLLKTIYIEKYKKSVDDHKYTFFKDMSAGFINLLFFSILLFRGNIFFIQIVKPAFAGSLLSLLFIILSVEKSEFKEIMKDLGNKVSKNSIEGQYIFVVLFLLITGFIFFNSILYALYKYKKYVI